jgi:hypothetical protein
LEDLEDGESLAAAGVAFFSFDVAIAQQGWESYLTVQAPERQDRWPNADGVRNSNDKVANRKARC